MRFSFLARCWTRASRPASWAALLLLGGAAHAQGPTITGLSPARNAVAAPRATNVALTFSQAISAASAGNVRVFSAQRGGQLVRAGQGAVSGGGTNIITFDHATDFKPGETVFVTVPPSVQDTGGTPATRHVYQFTTAVGGAGRGTFTLPATTPNVSTGLAPHSVAVGDVDGDGDLDLLSANSASTVSVRLNNGTGIFRGTQEVGTNGGSESLALGDIDNDGDLDLVTGNNGGGSEVSVRINDGAGNFSGTQEIGGGFVLGVALGDIDGDSDLDLLSVYDATNTVRVRRNTGNGTFAGVQAVSVGNSPASVAVGDVDGDGDLDLLTANNNNSGTVSVRFNSGTGVFSGTTEVPVGSFPTSVIVGDVDGDGDLDLLAADRNSSLVSVRFNNGTGAFSGTYNVSVGTGPEVVALGDLDNDGDLDLVASLFGGNVTLGTTVAVRRNTGNGTFVGMTTVTVGTRPWGVALGDVDSDGDLDLLCGNSNGSTVSVRLNGGTGPTGTSPDAATPSVCIWPNPATTEVRITGAPAGQPLTLLDATGRCLATLSAEATGAASLPVDKLAPGLYLLRAADGRTRRLVVE